jgi:hypothetical protein
MSRCSNVDRVSILFRLRIDQRNSCSMTPRIDGFPTSKRLEKKPKGRNSSISFSL